jgi:beta-N-acetylhexosaminidase
MSNGSQSAGDGGAPASRPGALIPVVAVVAVVALVAGALAVFGADDPEDGPRATATVKAATTPQTARRPPASERQAPATPAPPAPPAPAPAGVSPGRMIGQKIMVGFRQSATPPPALLSAIRRGRVGGVILFGENDGAGAGYGAVARQLQRAAAAGHQPALLISTDQEGGMVRRIADAPPSMSPQQMGARGVAAARRQGRATGQALRRRGINVNLAPVVDVPDSTSSSFLGTRTFGTTPEAVGAAAAAFAAGLQEGGVAATAKHYPGLGTTGRHNTDEEIVTVSASLDELTRRARPFRRLVAEGVQLVMVSNAIYTALDPDRPAVLSFRIVTSRLRSFFRDGVVISDALEAPAVRRYGAELPLLATRAGVDILLYSDANAAGAFDVMRSAYRAGTLSHKRLASSYARIMALKRRVAGAR